MIAEFLDSYPEAVALLILIVGLIVAQLASRLVAAVMAAIERLTGRFAAIPAHVVSPLIQRIARALVFWGITIVSVVLALRALDITELGGWLDGVLVIVPRLVIGAIIVGVGHVAGLIGRSLLTRYRGPSDRVTPALLHISIVIVAVVTALEHIGLDISFVTDLVLVLVTLFVGALALAFALGARQLVANLVAQGEVARYTPGERIRIDDDEGTIVEVHRTGVVVATSDGLVSIPAARFAEVRVLRVAGEPGDD